MAQPKAPRTKAHAVKFTDADWALVVEAAKRHGLTPAAFINLSIGDYLTGGDRSQWWEGLQAQGWPKGKKRKPTPTS